MNKTYEIQLELYEWAVKPTENSYVQGDTGVYPLSVQLLSNGQPFLLSSENVVSVNARNERTGIVYRGVAEIENAAEGRIVYHFIGGELSFDGEMTASVTVQDGDDRLTWQSFRFVVEKSLDGSGVIAPGPFVPWTAQIDGAISKIKQEISAIGTGGGSAVTLNDAGKLVINGAIQSGLDADSVGGVAVGELARLSDIPGAAALSEPIVELTNLIPNPATFTGWGYGNAALRQVEKGVVTIRNTHSGTGNPSLQMPSALAPVMTAAHKYYVSYRCRVRKPGGKELASFWLTSSETPAVEGETAINRWVKYAAVVTFPSGFGAYSMYIQGHTYTPNEYEIDFTEPIAVDLTAAFGAGNEPDTNWCAQNVPFFEGKKQVSAYGYQEKKMLCLGDSNTLRGVFSYVEKLPVNAVNAGFGGSTLGQGSGGVMVPYSAPRLVDAILSGDLSAQENGTTDSTFRRALNDLSKMNIEDLTCISLAYGTNDFAQGFTLGSDDMADQTTSTFKGALRYVIHQLQTALPTVRLLLITPGWRTDLVDGTGAPESLYTNKNAKGLLLSDYVEAMLAIGRYYNIPVVDIYHTAGVNDYNASLYLKLDGLHYNDFYQEIIAGKVMAALNDGRV